MTTTTTTGLIRICSWCKRMVDDDNKSFGSHLLAMFWEFFEGDKVSHTCCNSCMVIERRKLAQYKKDRATAK